MATSGEIAAGSLVDLQHSDGGWAYAANSSWTEPTCYAILALRSVGGPDRAIQRASEWLVRRQRIDGGWPPGPGVDQSGYVTSLAILALSGKAEYEGATGRGVEWLLAQSGAETSFWPRLARRLTSTQTSATEHVGWPWFPGAAAWVIPTSLAICALSKQRHGKHMNDIELRIKDGRRFLLTRKCPDHGWNHGGLFRSGETPVSYPETTGVALVALGAADSAVENELELSLRCAEMHARDPRSSEGADWLTLGLSLFGREPEQPNRKFRNWTVNQIALGIIAQSAKDGRNAFVDHV
jgi:hypothetical protein